MKIINKNYLGIRLPLRLPIGGIFDARLLPGTLEARRLVEMKSFSHSSIVSGSFFPAVSGKTKENNPAKSALAPKIVVGIAT